MENIIQQPNADGDGNTTNQFFQACFFSPEHPSDKEKVCNGRQNQLNDEFGRTIGIKQQRCEQQHIIADFLRRQEIDEKENRHEI